MGAGPEERPHWRLFFALWPGTETRRCLARAAAPAVAAAAGRPIAPDQYHLTLAFLGQVPAARLPDVTGVADGLVLPPVTLVLDRYGVFPRAEVLWLGPSGPVPALAAFVAELWRRLRAAGYPWEAAGGRQAPGEPGTFRPHLTLCRKVHRQPDVPPPEPVTWTPAGFVLVESRPAEAGSRYHILARYPGAG